jgi:hypothetical protein
MPVVATPTAVPLLTRDAIRVSMRDLAGRIPNTGVDNILLDNVEFSDDELDNAVAFTVDRYNAMPPVSVLPAEAINRYILMIGTVCFLLSSESWRQARNQATIQDGDVAPIGIDDKAQLYSQLAQLACNEFREMAKQVKIQRNMESAYGAIGSGYSGVARTTRG